MIIYRLLEFLRMTGAFVDNPKTMDIISNANPIGRIGLPEELRGVFTWLASDASSLCTGTE